MNVHLLRTTSCASQMDAVLIATRQTSPATVAYTHLRGLHKVKLSTRDFFLLTDLQPCECLVSPLTSHRTVAADLVATLQTPPIPIIHPLLGVAQIWTLQS